MLAFMLFAFVASITPGPTNLLVLGNSARHGLRAALPIILGAGSGAALIVWLVGAGLGRVLFEHPQVHGILNAAGILWLTWLAWKLYTSPADELAPADEGDRLGWWSGALLQLVNPKTWMMALAVSGVFAGNGLEVSVLALVFFVIALPCLGCWALLGRGVQRLGGMRWVNRGLAVLLLLSAWSSVLPSPP